MASRKVASWGVLPPETNHAHANQMIDMSGAVRRRSPARSVFIAGSIRLARLCVLIVNPILPRRSIHMDLAGSGIPPCPAPPPANPPSLTMAGYSTVAKGPGTRKDAVSTCNICSCGPERPGDPQEGATRSILPPDPTPATDNLDAGGPEHPESVYEPAHTDIHHDA